MRPCGRPWRAPKASTRGPAAMGSAASVFPHPPRSPRPRRVAGAAGRGRWGVGAVGVWGVGAAGRLFVGVPGWYAAGQTTVSRAGVKGGTTPAPAVRKITATLYYVADDGMALVPTQREIPF